jgi:hypothetical protein
MENNHVINLGRALFVQRTVIIGNFEIFWKKIFR